MTKISAIISAYYCEQYLEGRIMNLEAQSLKPEIVAVCQAGSEEEKIIDKFPGVVKVTTENVPTVYVAWNLGIEKASGEYLTSANSDDRHYPDALIKAVAKLEENKDASICYFDVDIVEEIGGAPTGRFEFLIGGFDELLNKGCFLGPMPVWRKELHEKYGLFSDILEIAGDYEFWLRVTKEGEKLIKYRGKAHGVYLKRPNSREHRERVKTVWETSKVRTLHRPKEY
jgi:glycosyltransferase involved in cell wall biosynthesis